MQIQKFNNAISVGCRGSNDQTSQKKVNRTKCIRRLNSSNGKMVKLLQTAELHSLQNLCQLVRQLQMVNLSRLNVALMAQRAKCH